MKTKPYAHQAEEFERSKDARARALLWQPRTGKTKQVIDTVCHLRWKGEIDGVLVNAPNGVHENWTRREIPTHLWDGSGGPTLAWRTSDRDEPEFRERFDEVCETDKLPWLTVNNESIMLEPTRQAIKEFVRARKGRVLVAFDESHDFRTPGSSRSKFARALSSRCSHRRILTGSVVTNSPLAAWAQFELLGEAALGFQRYEDFELNFAEWEQKYNGRNRYKKLKCYKNEEDLTRLMARWSSVVLRKDCVDMPKAVRSARSISLTDQQLAVYRQTLNQFSIEVEAGKIVDLTEGTVRVFKLMQIGGGYLIDADGAVHDIPGKNPKLDALSDEVFLTGGKVIVWAWFREDIRRVAERLRKDGHNVVEYHGGVNATDCQAAIDSFMAADGAGVFVGQPRKGGQGLNLSRARLVVWYSHTFDAIVREQADERPAVIGGEDYDVLDLVNPGADEYVLRDVAMKLNRADMMSRDGLKRLVKELEL